MAMLYAVFAAFAAASMVAVTMALAVSDNDVSKVRRHQASARYLAEGAVEQAKTEIAQSIADWEVPPATGSVTIAGEPVTYAIQPTGFNSLVTDAAGIQTLVTGYEITATARSQAHSFTAHRLVNIEATPVFQFAVFYTGDLEINPGPSMTLGGRVHTNADLYLNCGGTLTCNTNYLRAVGELYRHRKDNTSASEGTVQIREWVVNPFDAAEPSSYFRANSRAQMAALGIATTSGFDSNFVDPFDLNGDGDYDDPGDWYSWVPGALAYWDPPDGYSAGTGNTVLTGQHGVTQAAVPHIGSIAMYEPAAGGSFAFDAVSGQYVAVAPGTGTHDPGYYHAQADLSIITDANGTIRAYDKSGNDITASLGGVLSSKQMYDARQAGGSSSKVSLTQIDLAQLAALGKFPANGLIYAAHYGAGTGLNAKGVRLVNGSELASKLTVVSENSIYIQGDYNTVNKKGAAVIADAVNLLSNAWNDTKTKGTLPTATNTTFNVAMITGNQDTVTNGQYNGGLENLPRFHEKWTGKTCAITGSFVNTWLSQYATGTWAIGGDRYTAPTRNWNYDRAFNTVANLPPFTPMAVTARDVAAW
jgi:hypothetical protein